MFVTDFEAKTSFLFVYFKKWVVKVHQLFWFYLQARLGSIIRLTVDIVSKIWRRIAAGLPVELEINE